MPKKKPAYEIALLSVKKDFIRIAGAEAFKREYKNALWWFRSPELQECKPESIGQAFLNVALTGTTLIPTSQVKAYFVERERTCALDFTYRGLIKAATCDGAIVSMDAEVVYSWDKITYRQGTKAFINHVKSLDPPKDPDAIARDPKLIWEHLKCAYAVATLPNGTETFIILPKFKILKTWNNTAKTAINEAWPEEWIRKTAIRYLSKTLPSAVRLGNAVSVLNESEANNAVKCGKKKPASRLMERMGKK